MRVLKNLGLIVLPAFVLMSLTRFNGTVFFWFLFAYLPLGIIAAFLVPDRTVRLPQKLSRRTMAVIGVAILLLIAFIAGDSFFR